MTSLEYYIEQVEQFISALTDDIESGEGTVVTQTKLAVYREVLKYLEEIEQSYNSINPELNGDMISRQAVVGYLCTHCPDDAECFEDCDDIKNIKALLPVTPQPKTGHCKDCKWWKDSDGLYRRGGHAESKCPINRREVFEGNGYCYMFEPQERSEE